MNKTLILLLGNTNDSIGILSDESKERCKKASEVFLKETEAKILPTGGFGLKFNTTNTPHWMYLRDELVKMSIPKEMIINGINSDGSLEDLFSARRYVKDNSIDRVVIVSSKYHKERVEFICYRIFTDVEWFFEFCNIDENKDEKIKFKKLLKEWVDVPLYEGKSSFPKDIYENASKEHKHYDNSSIAFITAIIAVTGGSLTLKSSEYFCFIEAMILLFNSIMLLIYLKAADFAQTARRVMSYIEIAHNNYGASRHYYKNSKYTNNISIKELVKVIYLISFILLYIIIFSKIIMCIN